MSLCRYGFVIHLVVSGDELVEFDMNPRHQMVRRVDSEAFFSW